jgi:hypothetical protein
MRRADIGVVVKRRQVAPHSALAVPGRSMYRRASEPKTRPSRKCSTRFPPETPTAVHQTDKKNTRPLAPASAVPCPAPIAHEPRRDAVGFGNPSAHGLASPGQSPGRWDGGQLAMTQEARDDRLLGHPFFWGHYVSCTA